MKRIASLALLIAFGIAAYAQKEAPKPNVNKALALARQGKYDEAKAIVDAVPSHEKSKIDDKSWFFRGIVYVAMDTSSAYNTTGENYSAVAAEAFAKATELAGPKGKLSIMDTNSGATQTLPDLIKFFNNIFLFKGDKLFGQEKFPEAIAQFRKGLALSPDTAIFRYAGYAAHNANQPDQTIEFLTKYLDNGGTNSQALFLWVGSIYEYKKDFELALAAARRAMQINPSEANYRQIELNCLIELKRYQEAADNLQGTIAKNPKDIETLYLIGALNEELGKPDQAKEYMKRALEVDPKYMKAAIAIARYGNRGFVDVKQQMDQLDYKKDRAKLEQLDKQYVEKLREAAAGWENCEKIDPKEREVLENLELIYGRLDDKVKLVPIQNKMKSLGYYE
jgi:tetratricopeptide (TPR) repeat protein